MTTLQYRTPVDRAHLHTYSFRSRKEALLTGLKVLKGIYQNKIGDFLIDGIPANSTEIEKELKELA